MRRFFVLAVTMFAAANGFSSSALAADTAVNVIPAKDSAHSGTPAASGGATSTNAAASGSAASTTTGTVPTAPGHAVLPAWSVDLPPGTPDPIKTCLAYKSTLPAPAKKGHHPIKFVAKALASELGTDGSDMLKDSVFVFSAKDFDPYNKKAPTNKPYTLLEFEMIDGSQASLIKYPDNSGKIVGGFADGTIIAPVSANTYIMAYPNGARGKLVKVSGNEYDIYRPDKTVTRITKSSADEYSMQNSKLGYIGTARTDNMGMQFEMNSKDF